MATRSKIYINGEAFRADDKTIADVIAGLMAVGFVFNPDPFGYESPEYRDRRKDAVPDDGQIDIEDYVTRDGLHV